MNQSGYSDPTAEDAIGTIKRKESEAPAGQSVHGFLSRI